MGNKTVIISGGDKNYFEILCELIDSVLSHEQSGSVDLAIMDVGLAPDQAEHFANRGVHVFKPDWPCDIPARRIEGKEFLKACVCRPFLNTLLPDYEVYIWLDGDTWLQDWEAIEQTRRSRRGARTWNFLSGKRGEPGMF